MRGLKLVVVEELEEENPEVLRKTLRFWVVTKGK